MNSKQRRGQARPGNSAVFRQSALAVACMLAAGGALAQSANLQLTLPANRVFTSTYIDKYIQNNQLATAAQGATVTNVFNGASFVGASAAGTPVSVANNSSTATAIGNLVDPNMIDLFLAQPLGGSAGILSSQLRGGAPVATTAAQTSVTMGVQETGQVAAPVTVTGNAIGANTTLNSARSEISGALPGGYASATDGGVASTFNGTLNTTVQGGIGINSNQVSLNAGASAGSQAAATGSSVLLDLQGTAGALTSPLTLSGNGISTAYDGNAATNSVNVTGATTPFAGSIAVNNSQANIETAAAAGPTSTITTSQILADVTSRDALSSTVVAAPLTVSGNSVTATSSGNTAGIRSSSGITAGNSITIAQGVDVTGAGSATGNSLVNGSSTLAANLSSDLVLANGQGNQGSSLNSVVTGVNTTQRGGVISIRADSIGAGGSLTASDNAVSAASTGNLAGNLISANSANIATSAAAANSQSNDATAIGATVTNGTIAINVGNAGSVTGNVTASGNAVGASAEGNVAGTAVNLTGTNLTANASAATGATANTAGFGATSATAGASATNLQANYGATTIIGSTVSNSFIAANIADQSTGGTPLRGLSGANVTLDGNAITSAATGSSGVTSVALDGSNVTGSAAVGNDQFNGNIISGQNLNSGVTINAAAVSGSTATLTNSTVSSSGTANSATNKVEASGTTLTTGTSTISGTPSASVSGTTASSNASYAIASGQRNEGSVSSLTSNTLTAPTGGGFATVYAGDGISAITSSSVSVGANAVTSDTTGNRVTNGVTVSGSTLATPAGAATNVASVASLQVNEVTGVANATVTSLSPAVTDIGVVYAGLIGGANVTVGDNLAAATSLGNQATNSVTASGASLSSSAPAAASGTVNPAAGSVTNEFAVANVQSDSVSGGRAATVSNVTVGISNTGSGTSISSANLTVSDNQLAAEARNNDASNSATLTGFSSLNSGAGVLNQQSSSTNVSASVAAGRVRIRAQDASIGSSSLVMDSNEVSALAVGSSAGNSLVASASTLAGNANNTTSGVSFAGGVPTVTADYAVANAQSQTGSVTASTSTPIRIVSGDIGGIGGTVVSGGSMTVSNNVQSATAQATSAANTLALSATGNATSLTGAVGSGQYGSGAVTATVRPETNGAAVVSIDAASFGGTAVAATGNSLAASAGQNEAFNRQTVTGANVTGNGTGGANGADFTTANNQNAVGSVGSTVIPGIYGVAANSFVGGSVAVSGNSVDAKSTANYSSNAVALGTAGTTSGVTASASVANTQAATTGAVTSAVGSTVDVANDSIGVVPGTAGAGAPNFSGTAVTVSGNTSNSLATRNSTDNALTVAAATISGRAGITSSFDVSNAQSASASTTATTDLNVVGANVGSASGTSLSVGGNKVVSGANDNVARNGVTLAAATSATGSAFVANQQASGLAGDVSSATANVSTLGLATDSTGNSTYASAPVSVTGNQVQAQAGRNTATNSITASAATLAGAAVTGQSSFFVNSTQAAVGAVTSAATVNTIGATGTNATGGSFAVSGNRVDALSNANTATNGVSLSATSGLSGTGAVLNSQTSGTDGVVSAAVTTGAVGVQGGIGGSSLSGSPVTVSQNVMNAEASRNAATNTLQVAGVTVSGGTPVGAASFAVGSTQTGDLNVTATNNVGLIGSTVNSASGTTFGVVDNSVLASANVNVVRNALSLNSLNSLAGNGTGSIGMVTNTQNAGTSAGTAVSATVTGTSSLVPATVGVASPTGAAALNSAPTSVTGNVLAAQAGGNTATNTLEASAVNSVGGSAFPSFGVLNGQSNAASVSTTVSYANVGVNTGAAGSVSGSAVGVSANQVSAQSYGNSAYNAVSMTALIGTQNQASALVNNAQTNTAAINSTVTGVSIGMTGGGVSGGSTVVNNNASSALSVGNSAANYIVSK